MAEFEHFDPIEKSEPSDFVDERKKLTGSINYQETCAPAEFEVAQAKILEIKNWLKERYNVDVRAVVEEEQNYQSKWQPVKSLFYQAKQLEKIRAEIVRFPPSLFKKLGIKEFVLTGGIVKNDGQQRWAEVDSTNGRIIFFAVWPFFHELFHVIDYHMRGLTLYSGTFNTGSLYDLNPFPKLNREWEKIDLEAGNPSRGSEKYDEQQADFCSCLFNIDDSQFYQDVVESPRHKGAGMAKLEKMKKWLYEWSEGLLSEKFWHDIKDGKVDEEYWQGK